MARTSRATVRPLPRREPADATAATASTGPATEPTEPARLHIGAGGRVLIDLTDDDRPDGDPAPTTELTCPNCRGKLRVERVDNDLRAAEMHCLECHFRFSQRLVLGADAREQPTATTKPGRLRRKKR